MRLARPLLLAAALLAAVAGWPQDAAPPAADHAQHPLEEVPEGRPVPSLRLRLERDSMDGFNLSLDTRDFRFTPESVGSASVPNEGHAHLYLNGEKVARMYSSRHHVPSAMLRDGVNRVEVEFSTNDHAVWSFAGQPIGADVLMDTRDPDGDPLLREEVRYTLDWRWGRARRSPEGGWSVRTDRGFAVRVSAGRLVTRNLELIPCHAPAPPPAAALLLRFGLARARAGHSSLMPNESKIPGSVQEDLADPQPALLESRLVTDPEYCRAHYLVARPTGTGPGALALEVSGTWSRAGSAATPFRLQSAAAYGQFLDFRSASGAPVGRRAIVGGIAVTLRRTLGTMFDGIDFEAGGARDSGARVLRSLVRGTEVVVDAGRDDA